MCMTPDVFNCEVGRARSASVTSTLFLGCGLDFIGRSDSVEMELETVVSVSLLVRA